MTGLPLYELLMASLDLPESIKQEELQRLLSSNQLEVETLTVENLREAVAGLLHDLILEDLKNDQVQ